MTHPKCATCRFWNFDGAGPEAECRRAVPVIAPPPGTPPDRLQIGFWPVTDQDHWCGEHQPEAFEDAG